ncbi:MAG TPA: XTP/dITP diphosphatase [Virgibacillus sp.]|nr:XTP/dITP diphosphatase [Virgibacillus sp.]
MEQIIIATKNQGKAKEFRTFFDEFGIQALSLNDFGERIPDVEETGETFKENAALKAEQIASLMNQPVISDDSGLEIEALDGRPGVYSARYAGMDKNDQANIDKVLTELKDIPEGERQARFVCMLAVAIPNQPTHFEQGSCHGKIAFEQNGVNGFGYDPIFIPEGYTETLAQLTPEEKNRISHRRHAFANIESWVKEIKKRGEQDG